MLSSYSIRRFRFVGLLTVVAVYLLILVGGIVRSTGSGMGCPDWPKCFGQWVPPMEASQLPANYKEIYTAQRVAKNQKLARTLQRLGFAQVAGSIFAHPTQYIETDFNPVKTWIEYVNRLLGALIGIFVFLTVVFAWPYRRLDSPIFWLAFAAFFFTGVQGWLGSLVVSTNLLPVMVTVHMGLALVIVGMLLYAVDRSKGDDAVVSKVQAVKSAQLIGENQYLTQLQGWLWLVVLVTFIQIVLGTQVRERVDVVASAAGYIGRDGWVTKLGEAFSIHRSFSIVVLLLNSYVGYRLWQTRNLQLRRLVLATMGLIGLEIVAGSTLASLGLPPLVQPVHLTLAAGLFGVEFLTLLALRRVRKSGQSSAPVYAAQPVVA